MKKNQKGKSPKATPAKKAAVQTKKAKPEPKKTVITKKNQVFNHLLNNGSITSWDAIKLYGATRLSAIIFNLRKKGYSINTKAVSVKDRNGNATTYALYLMPRLTKKK